MKYFAFLITCCLPMVVSAQKMPDLGLNKSRIIQEGRTILLETNPVSSNPQLYTDRYYYWFSSNQVHLTQGGYSGKLLNGHYTEFYENKQLKEQGDFKKGLKQGVWKYWNEKGSLLETSKWDEGQKSGDFSLFDDDGRLKQSGSYKGGLLEGKISTYLKDSIVTAKYHQGKKLQRTSKRTVWQKLDIFKKEHPPKAENPKP